MASTKLVEFLKQVSADESLLRQWETERETLIARAQLPQEEALLLKSRDAQGLRSLISTMNSEVPLI